jgi:hypothetical protein
MASLADLHRARIEFPVHYDIWMRGARYGVVTAMRHSRNGRSAYASVKVISLPAKARRVKLWWPDFRYAKVAF